MATVGVAGLGAMGSRIARRLADAGHELVVWNRDPAKAEPLVGAGAVAAASPADLAGRVEAVITMVADPRALVDVTEGPDGVVAGMSEGTTLIQMSTVGLESISRLAALLTDDALLDSPVLGSVSEAESGTLNVFAGGEPKPIERWKSLLATLGTVLHVGPVGAGTAAKLVANTTLVGVIGLLGETLALADGLGLSREAAFEVLGKTALAEQAERRRPAIESGEYPARFALYLARKDADLIVEAAAKAGIELRLTEGAREWLADAEAAGLGNEDYSAVLARILEGRQGAR
ncbi:MAG: NAD(P)-dependent oxidoreductase [Actinobacteria bacterium]|nr:MAG: NAD(P)-dependent oxidoreductase [Actinomycetota bacterium]